MSSPREDAISIWQAGVAAVDSTRLVRQFVSVQDGELRLGPERFPLESLGRIVVVGGGKAGAGMAAGLEEALPGALHEKLTGLVNVPHDCVRKLRKIELHAARPAGANEPTAVGVAGVQRMLEMVGELGPDDLCIVLISGGGSALLPAPISPVTLEDKLTMTRQLSAAGATIQELNSVRKVLSTVKGGGLGRAIRAGHTVTLIISDIIGDPLDAIASGPTVASQTSTADARAVLQKYLPEGEIPESIRQRLAEDHPVEPVSPTVKNWIIGNNATALAAADAEARRRGYLVKNLGSENAGDAAAWGALLAEAAIDARSRVKQPFCILAGGETTVRLDPSDQTRLGGRNQEIALAAVARLWDEDVRRIAILSGGTDGEDGPTNAAGAVADAGVIAAAARRGLDPREYLAIHNSHPFFRETGGLVRTGPTHTNVMDLQVVTVQDRGSETTGPPRRAVEKGRKRSRHQSRGRSAR